MAIRRYVSNFPCGVRRYRYHIIISTHLKVGASTIVGLVVSGLEIHQKRNSKFYY